VIECLHNKYEALSSNPSTGRKIHIQNVSWYSKTTQDKEVETQSTPLSLVSLSPRPPRVHRLQVNPYCDGRDTEWVVKEEETVTLMAGNTPSSNQDQLSICTAPSWSSSPPPEGARTPQTSAAPRG
jgi:hypothetical protein